MPNRALSGAQLAQVTAEKIFGWKSVQKHASELIDKKQDRAGRWRTGQVPNYNNGQRQAYAIDERVSSLDGGSGTTTSFLELPKVKNLSPEWATHEQSSRAARKIFRRVVGRLSESDIDQRNRTIRRWAMRFLLKVNIPVEAGNAAAKAGKLGATIQSILADLKPETVYFTDDNGQRTGFIFLDMQDASQIPAIAEPWFLAFNASLEIHPVMIPEDLAKAGGAIEAAVKKYA